MKARVFFFLLFTAAAWYFMRPSLSLPSSARNILPNNPTVVTVEVPVEVVREVTRVVLIQPEPLPTQTPYPTYTPVAPVVVSTPVAPVAVTNADPWLTRIFLIGFMFIGAFVVFALHQARKDKAMLIREQIYMQQERDITERMPTPRPIVVNRTPTGDDVLETTRGEVISRDKAIEFILNAKRIGLSISAWRTEMDWPQTEVEKMLDWWEDLGIVTPRQIGIAAQWAPRGNIQNDMLRIARRMGLSNSDLSRKNQQEAGTSISQRDRELPQQTLAPVWDSP